VHPSSVQPYCNVATANQLLAESELIFLSLLTIVLMLVQVVLRLVRPEFVPPGLKSVLLAVMFFGSLSVFSIAVLGEYLAKVFEEVKHRPLYIRRSLIRDGEIRPAIQESDVNRP
jgi:hypothetical protein